jgi:hypothetical protein
MVFRKDKTVASPPPIRAFDGRLGPARWRCKQCGRERRLGECLHCGNKEPITDEPRVPGIIR